MSTAETVFGFVPGVARAICEACGCWSVAVGPRARAVLAAAADAHDAKCRGSR